MTTSRAALTTITATLSDGTPARIIGRVDSFPGHPAAGTAVEPLTTGSAEAATDHDAPLFALVSVTWATEVTTINPNTGVSRTEYVPAFPGMPAVSNPYLTPNLHGSPNAWMSWQRAVIAHEIAEHRHPGPQLWDILAHAATLASQPGDITEGLRPGRWPDIDRHRPNHAR